MQCWAPPMAVRITVSIKSKSTTIPQDYVQTSQHFPTFDFRVGEGGEFCFEETTDGGDEATTQYRIPCTD